MQMHMHVSNRCTCFPKYKEIAGGLKLLHSTELRTISFLSPRILDIVYLLQYFVPLGYSPPAPVALTVNMTNSGFINNTNCHCVSSPTGVTSHRGDNVQ